MRAHRSLSRPYRPLSWSSVTIFGVGSSISIGWNHGNGLIDRSVSNSLDPISDRAHQSCMATSQQLVSAFAVPRRGISVRPAHNCRHGSVTRVSRSVTGSSSDSSRGGGTQRYHGSTRRTVALFTAKCGTAPPAPHLRDAGRRASGVRPPDSQVVEGEPD